MRGRRAEHFPRDLGGPAVVACRLEGEDGNGLGWKVDTRGNGGYAVGPGSYVDLPDGTGHTR